MISVQELSAIIKSIIISNPKITTIEGLEREFRENEGFPMPLCGYSNVQDLLMNGLSNAVKVYGHGPKATVQAILNAKIQHIHALVTEQKAPRQKKRPPKTVKIRHPTCRYAEKANVGTQCGKATENFQSRSRPNYNAVKIANKNGNNILRGPLSWQKNRNQTTVENWRSTVPQTQYQNRKSKKKTSFNNSNIVVETPPQSQSSELSSNGSSNDIGHTNSCCKYNASSEKISKVYVNNNNLVSDYIDYKENDFDRGVAVTKNTSENRSLVLENLHLYQSEILNTSNKTKSVQNIDDLNEFEKNSSVSFKSSNSFLDKQSGGISNYDDNIHEYKDTKSSKIFEEIISKHESNEKAHVDMDSFLPHLIFADEDVIANNIKDLDEAVPNFAINNRVFSLDFPEQTVTFGTKIEPFEMPNDVQVDSIISIYISEIHNPFRFWFHYDIDALDDLMHKIELFYAQDAVDEYYKMIPEQIHRGQVCVALYCDAWHRAEILSNIIEDKVKVYYLDYGTVGDVHIDDLLYLNVEFAQQQAIACRGSLADINPIRLHWNTEATSAFLTMVKNRKLHAKIAEIDVENRIYYLNVVDSHDDNITNINRELIKMKHATKCYEWVKSKLTGTPRLRHKREEYPTFEMLEDGDYPTFDEIISMEINGINYEDMTDKMIYHPNIVHINNFNNTSFLLLSNNPFKEDIEKQLLNKALEESK